MKRPQNWNQPCPNTNCRDYGQQNQGNVRSISTYLTQSGKRRIFECTTCGQRFSETRNTVFFDLRTPEATVMLALKMLLVRVSLSNISFVLGVTEETVLEWLEHASAKATEINAFLLKELPVTVVQLDEMWSFVKRKGSKEASKVEASKAETPKAETPKAEVEACADEGQQWVFVSDAPEFRLMLTTLVGPRTYETALTLIQQTARIVLGIPVFFSDGFSSYLAALIECFHTLQHFPRTGKPGRPRKPVKEPHPDLVYAQVVKKRRKGRVVSVTTRVVCGAQRLTSLGLSVSTSLLERLNLTFRQSLAPWVRKSLSFAKQRDPLQQHVTFFQAFYNVARPHMSLREPLNDQASRFERKWQETTPAMAAGITHHVWTFREWLTAKIPQTP